MSETPRTDDLAASIDPWTMVDEAFTKMKNHAEELEREGLTTAPYSRWALMSRHHDQRRDQWTEWKEEQGCELWEKFGATVDEWKQHAKSWIEMGGTYEIKIVQITERVEWSIHYDNKEIAPA